MLNIKITFFILLLCNPINFLLGMDFNNAIVWLKVQERSKKIDYDPVSYYFSQVQAPSVYEESNETILSISGDNGHKLSLFNNQKECIEIDYSMHTSLRNPQKDKSVKLEDFRNNSDVARIVFLDAHNKIMGAISPVQLKMHEHTLRTKMYTSINFIADIKQSIFILHTLGYKDIALFQEAYGKIHSILEAYNKKHNVMQADLVENPDGNRRTQQYALMAQEEVKDINNALEEVFDQYEKEQRLREEFSKMIFTGKGEMEKRRNFFLIPFFGGLIMIFSIIGYCKYYKFL